MGAGGAGISGTVIEQFGNEMPRMDGTIPRLSSHPCQNVPVIAQELRSQSCSLHSLDSHLNFIKMTQTDSEGQYYLDLPAGLEVTILAWIKNETCPISYGREGRYSSIKVSNVGYAAFDIEDKRSVVYLLSLSFSSSSFV